MKKILFVGHEASRTGAPRSLLNIAKICRDNGYGIEFIVGRPGKLLAEYEALAATHIWNSSSRHPRGGFLGRLLGKTADNHAIILKKIRRSPPDLIINNTIATGSILERLSSRGCPVLSRIPELETVIQLFGKEPGKVFEHSDMFVAVSHAVKANIIANHGIAGDKIRVIHGFAECVDVERYRSGAGGLRRTLGIPADAFVVGNCASLIYRKGFDYFIEAAARLQARNVYFLWVGGQPLSGVFTEVLHDIQKRGLHDTVKFVGEQDDIFSYLALLNAVFLPSREDPFPVFMLEAAQFGLPVVGFRGTGGVEEFLAAGGGLLADYANVDGACSAISAMQSDAALYEKLSQESMANFRTYSREAAGKQWLDLIGSRIC